MSTPNHDTAVPQLSMVMPCYNEEAGIGYTIPRLTAAFRNAGIRLELIAVDNGSHDRTGELIRQMAAQDPCIVLHRVETNEGYGNGVLQGLTRATAPWVGVIPADGQVDDDDVVRLYQAVAATDGRAVAKVRRRFRMDGPIRKVVSIIYNLFVRLLWPGLQSIDVNGSPKILSRQVLESLALESKDWLLDPEILIKAHYRNLKILEFNVFARMRGNGISHVRPNTCWAFLSRLLWIKLNGHWKRQAKADRQRAAPPLTAQT